MARGSRISILGLYTFDNSIFDNFVIPESVDRDVLIQNILMECAEFEILYPDSNFMKNAIEQWSLKENEKWTKMNDILKIENPLNDVDIVENTIHDITKHESGNESHVIYSKTSSLNQVNGWNDGLTDRNKIDGEENSTNTRTPNLTNTDNGERTKTIKGLSGKYLKQDVLMKEMEIRKLYNIDDIIIDDFKNRFCLLIY